MGLRNVLIEGVSGTGKTTVGEALQRLGHHVVHGDRELAYAGDPVTGERLTAPAFRGAAQRAAWNHGHHVWDVARLAAHLADHRHPVTFVCGGARNHPRFLHLFDQVFILDIDRATLLQRLAGRARDEFGGTPEEQALITRLHATRHDLPATGITIDATAPLADVVDAILSHALMAGRR